MIIRRRSKVDHTVKPDAQVQVTGADLSARDNAALAVAMTSVVAALADLRDRLIIDDPEFLRMAYRFAGEVTDVEAMIARGRKAGDREFSTEQVKSTGTETKPVDKSKPGKGQAIPGKPGGVEVSKDTGEVTGLPKEE